jgi:hypothetical protein
MKKLATAILCFLGMSLLIHPNLHAQNLLEGVEVETYYISTEAEEGAEVGGNLPAGSVTYRVYVDLAPGVRLRALYGNATHPIEISAEAPFFNNNDRGELWGHLIRGNRLDENTVALDSWLSLGAASDDHWGVLKQFDPDGSVVGGDAHESGWLTNDAMGIALTEADGLASWEVTFAQSFFASGDPADAAFGEATETNSVVSSNFRIQQVGVVSPDEDNRFLVAQITTGGDLVFKLNIEVVTEANEVVRIVSDNTVLGDDEVFSNFLSYPPVCGCTDPFFLEFDPIAGCDDGSCQTEIVFGCNDPLACNYDPNVNLNVPELCCILPDNCAGLDPDLICPDFVLSTDEPAIETEALIYPNPAHETASIQWPDQSMTLDITVYSSTGQTVLAHRLERESADRPFAVPLDRLQRGVYFIVVADLHTGKVFRQRLIKN